MAESIGLRAVLDLSQFNKGLSSYNKGISSMSKGTANFASTGGKQLASLGTSLLKIGTIAGGAALAGVTALGAGLAGFAVSGISQAKDLDQQMADIAAVMGKTKDEVQPLKDLILELSINPNLKVNATEAAQAVELLARNGVSATDIIDGMAESTVALANATGADFGVAADLATDVMALFSEQGVTMENAIDGITGVTTNSKFTVDDYAQAMANMGGAASGLGLDFRQLNALLAATAPTFKSGSEAGTALRNIFLRLSDPTSEASELMQQYGISLFDTEGNMRDIGAIASDLSRTLQGTATITQTVGGVTDEMAKAAESANAKLPKLNATISEQERELVKLEREHAEVIRIYGESSPAVEDHTNKILTLTDKLGLNRTEQQKLQSAISAVQNARAETITTTQQLTDEEKAHLESVLGGTRGVNALVAISKIQDGTFESLTDKVNEQGQAMRAAATRVDSLQGAMEIFRSIVQSVQIQVGDAFLPILRKMLVAFSDIASSQGPKLVAFFGSVAEIISKVSGAFARFGIRGATISILGLLGLDTDQRGEVLGVIDGIIAAVTSAFDKVSGAFSRFGVRGAGISILGLLGLSPDTIATVLSVVDTVIAVITNLATQIISITSQISFDEILGALTGIGAVLAGGVFAAIVAGLLSILTPINLIIAAAALLGAAWAGNWFNIQGITQQALAVVLTGFEVLRAIFASVIAVITPALESLGTSLASLGINWSTVFNAIGTATAIVGAAIGAILLALVAIVTGVIAAIASAIDVGIAVFRNLLVFIEQAITGIIQFLIGFVEFWSGIFTGDLPRAFDGFKLAFEGIGNFLEGIFGAILTTITGSLAIILTAIGTFITSVIDFFTSLYNNLVGNSIIPDIVAGIIASFTSLLGPVLDIFSTLSEGIANVLGSIFGGGGEEAAAPTFNSEAMLAGIQLVQTAIMTLDTSINNISIITIPILSEAFTLLTSLMLTQLNLVLTTGIMPIDLALNTISTATLPLLQATFITASAATVTALTTVQNILNVLIGLMQTLIGLVQTLIGLSGQLGQAMERAGDKAAKGLEKAAKALEDKLIPAMKNAQSTAESLASALERVVSAGRAAGRTSASATGAGFQHGLGFQAGTPSNTNGLLGLGYRIPQGFPGDTFGPLFAQSGEELLITPRGTSIENLVFSRLANLLRGQSVQGGSVTNNITNNYNLRVQTTASAQGTIRQYNVMRGFVGN